MRILRCGRVYMAKGWRKTLLLLSIALCLAEWPTSSVGANNTPLFFNMMPHTPPLEKVVTFTNSKRAIILFMVVSFVSLCVCVSGRGGTNNKAQTAKSNPIPPSKIDKNQRTGRQMTQCSCCSKWVVPCRVRVTNTLTQCHLSPLFFFSVSSLTYTYINTHKRTFGSSHSYSSSIFSPHSPSNTMPKVKTAPVPVATTKKTSAGNAPQRQTGTASLNFITLYPRPMPKKLTLFALIVAVAAVPKKKMTAYNEFMKTELPKYKEKHAGVEHKVKKCRPSRREHDAHKKIKLVLTKLVPL